MRHGVAFLARDQLTTPTFLNWRAKKTLRSFVVVNGEFTKKSPKKSRQFV